jgi:hypothetical protein
MPTIITDYYAPTTRTTTTTATTTGVATQTPPTSAGHISPSVVERAKPD